MNRIKECKKLLKDNEIIIVSPAYNNRNEIDNKLRVYASGGIIGKIYVGDNKNAKSKLISSAYEGYLKGDDKRTFKNILKIKNKTDDDIIEIMTSKEYIKLTKKALNKKWNIDNNIENNEEKQKKERNIQNIILKKYMYSNKNWNAVDMEVCFPEEYCKKGKFTGTKKPRFDIVTISKDGIGIIELKVNNKSCQNMKSHYEHMKFVRDNPDEFRRGILKKLEYLIENDLLSEKDYLKYKKDIYDKMWFGFLFVGGRKESTIKILKNKLGRYKDFNNIKFMYCDYKDIDSLNIERMRTYEDFIKKI